LDEEGLTASLFVHQPTRLRPWMETLLRSAPVENGSGDFEDRESREGGVDGEGVESREGGADGEGVESREGGERIVNGAAIESAAAVAGRHFAGDPSSGEPAGDPPVKAGTSAETPPAARAHNEKQPPAGPDGELLFQSYHTIDYFASQGIRLQ